MWRPRQATSRGVGGVSGCLRGVSKIVFVLESGFNPGTGRLNQGGDEFAGHVHVGLKHDRYGVADARGFRTQTRREIVDAKNLYYAVVYGSSGNSHIRSIRYA